jgi:hypothetical protein
MIEESVNRKYGSIIENLNNQINAKIRDRKLEKDEYEEDKETMRLAIKMAIESLVKPN